MNRYLIVGGGFHNKGAEVWDSVKELFEVSSDSVEALVKAQKLAENLLMLCLQRQKDC